MDKKRIYIRPSMRVVMLNGHTLLLTASQGLATPPTKFVDDSTWEWDDQGAN